MGTMRSTRYIIYRRILLACLYAKINLVWNRWLLVLWFLQLYIRPSQVTIRLHETSEADMAHKFWSFSSTRRRLSNGLTLPYEDNSQNSTASGLTQIFRVPVKLFDFRPLAASWNGRCRVLPVATIVNCQRNHSIGPFCCSIRFHERITCNIHLSSNHIAVFSLNFCSILLSWVYDSHIWTASHIAG